jgi:alpha/beta superfamily hydrolase
MYSVYIPRVSVEVNENIVQSVFHYYGVGTILRVDFTSVNKKKGFYESGEELKFKSAFVHFINEFPNNNYIEMLKENKVIKIIPRPDSEEYWLLMNVKQPVPFTQMNIHQVVDNAKYLEERIESQQKEIEELKQKVNQLMKWTL